jgi:2,3,4,5-tetrahydropyridine-2-carboxylate N-succinyltransferase
MASTLEHTHAWGYGLATMSGDGTVLDTWYPTPHLGRMPAGVSTMTAPESLTDFVREDARRNVRVDVVAVEIELLAGPQGASDAYLRLHLLSHLLVAPNTINLDGIFGQLPNVAWTTAGPIHPDDVTALRPALVRDGIQIQGIDRFPRLTDYVTPDRVRIADASRVRLGAHLPPAR